MTENKSEPYGSFFLCVGCKLNVIVIDFTMAKKVKKRKQGDNGVVIATVIVTLLFVVSAGYLIGDDNLVSGVFAKKTDEEVYYFLTTDTFEDVVLARQNADIIKGRGGAGYVDMRAGNRIILAVYPDEQSAKSVLEKLGDNSIVSSEIKLPKIKMNLKNNTLNDACEEGLKYFQIAFDGLYDLSNSLADNKVTLEDVKVQLSVLRSQIEDIKSAFYEKTKDVDHGEVTEIKVAIVTCLALVDGVEMGSLATTLSSLRRQTVQLVYCRQGLLNTLSVA